MVECLLSIWNLIRTEFTATQCPTFYCSQCLHMILFCRGIRFAQQERQIKSGGGIVTSVAKEREVVITLTVFTYGLFNEAPNV